MGDAVDDDCDGLLDCYIDQDGDGYGDLSGDVFTIDLSVASSCVGSGSAAVGGDCDDTLTGGAIHPDAIEQPADGVDQNCDLEELCYIDGDLDGHGVIAGTTTSSTDLSCAASGVSAVADDCDDGVQAISPSASEAVGDAVDDDCDGLLDCFTDLDADRYGDDAAPVVTVDLNVGSCDQPGSAAVGGDCDDTPGPGNGINPGTVEVPADGIDQNCDQLEDCYLDGDLDGFGVDTGATTAHADLSCLSSGVSPFATDCDDGVFTTNPGVTEVCGGAQDDCNVNTPPSGVAVAGTGYATIADAVAAAGASGVVDICHPAAGGSWAEALQLPYALTLRGYPDLNGTRPRLDVAGAGAVISSSSDLVVQGLVLASGAGELLTSCGCRRGGGIYHDNSNATLSLSDVQVTGSSAQDGAGIYALGVVSLAGVEVDNNVASGVGGGLYLGSGAVDVDATTWIHDNDAVADGGGVYLAGGALSGDALVEFNRASVDGAGVYMEDGSSLSGAAAGDLRIITNTATQAGGGVAGFGATLSLVGVQILNNQAQSGGGLSCVGTCVVDLNAVEISNNNASVGGGGLEIGGSLTASNGLISFNVAPVAGGVWFYGGVSALNWTDVQNNTASSGQGGGIFLDSGGLTLNGLSVDNNHADANTGYGGGVFMDDTSAGVQLSLSAAGIRDNSASYGGGLFLSGVRTTNSVTMQGALSYIESNTSTGTGAGVYVEMGTLSGGEIRGNIAGGRGGGVYIGINGVLNGVTITANQGSHGAGVSIRNQGTLSDLVVSGNTSSSTGGGLLVAPSGAALRTIVTNSSFSGNVGMDGGNVAVLYSALVDLLDCNLDTGRATISGGGLYVGDTSVVTFSGAQSSLNGNSAASGGGVAVAGSLTLSNTVVDNNTATSSGGGAFVYSTGTLNADQVEMTNNDASKGGGVYVFGGSYSQQVPSGVTTGGIGGNTASSKGGAIYLNGGSVNLSFIGVGDNIAPYGAGVYMESGTLILDQARMVRNVASGQGGAVYLQGGMLTANDGSWGVFPNNNGPQDIRTQGPPAGDFNYGALGPSSLTCTVSGCF